MAIFGRRLVQVLGSFPAGLVLFAAMPALAVCDGLPDHQTLRSVLAKSADASGESANDQLNLSMSATVVGSDGTVCSIEISVAYGNEPAGEDTERDPLAGQRIAGWSAAGGLLPNSGRIAIGAGFAASGYIRKDPPLTAAQLEALRLRALKQAF